MSSESRLSDTPPEIRRILVEGYRRMSPSRKLECVHNMTNAVLQLALARIRKQHPGIPEREERLRLASLWIDRQTMIKAFNWDPAAQGY